MNIRMTQFLKIMVFVTTASILYVWQQTEIVKLAYEGHHHLNRFQELLDENSILRYNLKKKASVVNLGAKGFSESDFSMPSSYCVVKVSEPRQRELLASSISRARKTFFARLLNLGKEAQAKTIRSSFTLKTE